MRAGRSPALDPGASDRPRYQLLDMNRKPRSCSSFNTMAAATALAGPDVDRARLLGASKLRRQDDRTARQECAADPQGSVRAQRGY